LALEACEVFPNGVAIVEIADPAGDDHSVVLVEGDEVLVEGGVLGLGEAETIGGMLDCESAVAKNAGFLSPRLDVTKNSICKG